MLKEYLQNRFEEINQPEPSKFEQTYFSQYLVLYKEIINSKPKKSDKKITKEQYNQAYNELKFVILTITKDIKNLIRQKYNLEFDENQNFLKSQNYNKIFLEKEKEIILTILTHINNALYNDFKFEYNENKGSDLEKTIIENKKFNIFAKLKIGSKITTNLKYLKFGICRDFSLIYLSIFQLLNFPLEKISIGLCPKHVFFRYIFEDKTHINWETTVKKNNIMTDKIYIDGKRLTSDKMNEETLDQTIYLKNLSKDETLSILYQNFANEITSDFEIFEISKKYYLKALELSKKDPELYLNYSMDLAKESSDNFHLIVEYLLKAINLNNKDANLHFTYSFILLKQLETPKQELNSNYNMKIINDIIFHLQNYLKLETKSKYTQKYFSFAKEKIKMLKSKI